MSMTLIGTVRIWSDPPSLNEAWRRWVDARPPGSVGALSPGHDSRRISLGGFLPKRVRSPSTPREHMEATPTPFDAFPAAAISRIWHIEPGRWRAETTAEGASETGVLVMDGDRNGFAVARRDVAGQYRMDLVKTSPLGLHGVIPDMVRGENILRVLTVESRGIGVQAGRKCARLVGKLIGTDDFPAWPADSYDLLVDQATGSILFIEAESEHQAIARAEFIEVAFGAPIDETIFALSVPVGPGMS